jgi:hypothetical protein
VVYGWDDVGDVPEEAVGVDFVHCLLHGFGAKRAANLFEREEFVGCGVFY